MTQREREILIASVSWTDKTLTVNEEKAFQAGAKWADEHPKSEMLKRNSMTRNEEIQKLIDEEMGIDNYGSCDFQVGVIYGVKHADRTMIEKACKCYCDDICDKGRCGMCFHKHDGKGQVKNTFRYNECNELKLIRKAMEK